MSKTARGSGLYWLPDAPDWRKRVMELPTMSDATFEEAVSLARVRLTSFQTNALDERVNGTPIAFVPRGSAGEQVKLAILGSSTLAHLPAAIRVAGLRRRLWVTTYENSYGQYYQELVDPTSALHAFSPNFVLFCFDAEHLTRGVTSNLSDAEANALFERVLNQIRDCWRLAREQFGAAILQQTIINGFSELLGQNEHTFAGSPSQFVDRLNVALRSAAAEDGVSLVAVDRQIALDGLAAWHDVSLWRRTKQDVLPTIAPRYGELVARVIAAKRGLSMKCLVLDLDNTLWGGVIGDDGLSGIVLGQGSGEGEGYLAFQKYIRDLSRRGVILAVCSKNDEQNALEPFLKHPDMILSRDDIACFRANWLDKASNIRDIAATLNIGIESLVFIDDNPAERALVRQELPMVAVPEFIEDPAHMPRLLADAGYFESLGVTIDDRQRSDQYQANIAREALRTKTDNIEAYLRGLDMELVVSPFDNIGLTRIVQLINKTNQFNLTTRRYTEEDIRIIMADRSSFGLQLRLIDRFGDNGIISIIIGKLNSTGDAVIDTWLMSCRVLGRQVEEVTLNVIAEAANALGACRLVGEYIPTKKNGMVEQHYQKLGFVPDGLSTEGRLFSLPLKTFTPKNCSISVKKE